MKIIVIPVLLMVLGVLFLLACIGDRDHHNKQLYAAVAVVLFVLLLISTRI